jgi:outer membrane autotransporter protein
MLCRPKHRVGIYRCLLLTVLFNALTISQSLAANLGPGQSATINAGDLEENWSVRDGGWLVFTPGAQALTVTGINGSRVALTDALVSGRAVGVDLTDSAAHIRGSTVRATAGYGLQLITRIGGTYRGSHALVVDSDITGVDRGISATHKSSVELINTHVHGTGAASSPFDGGVGMLLLGANASLTNSTVRGDQIGVTLATDSIRGVVSNQASLHLNNSIVQGAADSAIIVSGLVEPGLQAVIDIYEGSQLIGGNGVILEVRDDAQAKVTVDNSVLTGDVIADATASARLTLQNRAWLTGNVEGVQTLTLDASSGWTVEGDSTISALDTRGMVDLRGGDGNASFSRLTLGELGGSGTFALGTDLAVGQGDLLVVTGDVSGNHLLAIQNTGADVAEGQDPLTLVQTGGGDGQFGVIGGQVDLGTFVYDLEQTGNDWQLVQRPGQVVTPGTASVLGLFSAAPTVWYGELSSLRSRMGELRLGTAQGGLWSRAYGNKYNLSTGAGVAYKQRQGGLSIGADAALPVADGHALVGAIAGSSRSDLDLQAGTSGKVDSYYVGLYGTWVADSGYYADAVVKFNRFQNASDVRMSDGTRTDGDYSNHGLGVSVETGRRIKLGKTVTVTPFVQVSALKVQGEKYHLDNGMQARSNKADSLVGKVGAMVGQRLPLDTGGSVDYYVKAAMAHEFANGNTVQVNGNRFNSDLSGSRGELGVGLAVQVSERLQVHTELDYAKGRHLEQPLGVNVGVRYSF